jgi:NDP-sugar pyrophosphorylase family protein
MRHDAIALLKIEEVPVAILAGGLATRLRPITQTIPKALVEVAGKPFLDHQLALLFRKGLRRVVLCLGHFGAMVEEYVGDGSAWGLEVRCRHDGDKLLGTGGALQRAVPLLGDVFWVLYGDSYLDFDYAAVWDDFCRHCQALGLMTVLRNDNCWDRSNVVFHDGRLLCYDKRKATPEMSHIDYGAALLRREAVALRPADQPWDLADLYCELVRSGEMIGHEVHRRFYEIGSPTGLAETADYLRVRAA